MRRLSAIVLAFSVLQAAQARDLLPSGWRLAAESPSAVAVGDVNGDGTEDRAVLVTDGQRVKVLAFISGSDGFAVIDLITAPCDSAVCGVKMLPPGKYLTACGKKYSDCEEGEPEMLASPLPLIAFFDENVEIAFIFEKNGIHKVWLSD